MNKEARDNAVESLRLALKDKQTEIYVLEGELANNAIELNYTRDKQERSDIHQRLLTDEERMRDLQQELQGLMDQIYSLTS